MKHVIVGILASATLAATGCGGPSDPAVAAALVQSSPAYVAAGDSVPFGYASDLLPPGNDHVFDATAYPWYLAQRVDLPLVNAACPGQTTDGLVSQLGSDRGCLDFRASYPRAMHVAYAGSQLEFLLEYLAAHPRVRLLTLMTGADDVQLLADGCRWDPACIAEHLPATLQALADDLGAVLGALHAAPGDPQILLQNYYSPYPAGTPYEPVLQWLNATLEDVGDAFGLQTADVYRAFQEASAPFGGDPCAAGLLQVHPDGSCSVHPSAAGAQLIADSIAPLVAAWTGKP